MHDNHRQRQLTHQLALVSIAHDNLAKLVLVLIDQNCLMKQKTTRSESKECFKRVELRCKKNHMLLYQSDHTRPVEIGVHMEWRVIQ